jgi:aspartate-semialdehyde dehydrogenase
MNRNPHVAVVGATGAVGIEMIKTLEKRNFPVGKLTLLASARSVGKKAEISRTGRHRHRTDEGFFQGH